MRPMRSWLFVPANRPELFEKVRGSEADAIIFDLEDSVSPDEKNRARDNLALGVAMLAAAKPAVAVRVNAPDTLDGLRDLVALAEADARGDWIVVPKSEAATAISQVRAVLPDTHIMALVESARGIAALGELATSPADALLFGAGDYLADIGAEPSAGRLLFARLRIVEAAATAGIPAIDTPCFSLDDAGVIAAECRTARAIGFSGKAAVHPCQVSMIMTAFAPTAEEIGWARRVLEENEKGAGRLDGQMIDEAIARRARRILAATTTGDER